MGQRQVQTSAINLINQVVAIPGQIRKLTVEQSNMAFWAANVLQEYVNELIVCEPRRNSLISFGENKNDKIDTLDCVTLLRLGHLKAVWRPAELGKRRVFFHQVKEYHRLTKAMAIHKRQLQDGLRHWGISQKVTTIIVSQIPVTNWYDVIGDSTVADAILDRLIHTAHRVELGGESMRKKQ